MMRRSFVILLIVCVMTALSPSAAAAPQYLAHRSYKFYPLRDLVFVDFHNPYLAPVDNVTVNMTVREGTGRNRVIAIGQARLPEKLVLMPGEHTSTGISIQTRVVRDIPPLAQFEFHITGRQIEASKVPPGVVVQGSSDGTSLAMNRDANDVSFVMGFISLDPAIVQETTAIVEMAILTFYDKNHEIVWSEVLPINGKLTDSDSLMVWSKYDQARSYSIPDIDTVDAKFVVSTGK